MDWNTVVQQAASPEFWAGRGGVPPEPARQALVSIAGFLHAGSAPEFQGVFSNAEGRIDIALLVPYLGGLASIVLVVTPAGGFELTRAMRRVLVATGAEYTARAMLNLIGCASKNLPLPGWFPPPDPAAP